MYVFIIFTVLMDGQRSAKKTTVTALTRLNIGTLYFSLFLFLRIMHVTLLIDNPRRRRRPLGFDRYYIGETMTTCPPIFFYVSLLLYYYIIIIISLYCTSAPPLLRYAECL
jgi:hypothetical protein